MIQDPDIFRQQEIELRRLSKQSDDLKRLYDNYFVGLEKRQPGLARARLDRAIRETKLHTTLSTVLRFKFRQFLARYRTYTTNWDRICREIEEGTYRRGATTAAERLAHQRAEAALRRARGVDDATDRSTEDLSRDQRRLKNAAKEAEAFLASILGGAAPTPSTSPETVPSQGAKSNGDSAPAPPVATGGPPPPVRTVPTRPTNTGGPPPLSRTESAPPPPPIRTRPSGPPPPVRTRPASPPAPVRPSATAGSRPPPGRTKPPLPSADRLKPKKPKVGDSRDGVEALYASYVHARQSQGDDVSRVSFKAFTKSVEKQKEKARSRLNTNDVVLRVRVKDGKVKLVASKTKKDAPPAG